MHELTIIVAQYFVAIPVITYAYLFFRLKDSKVRKTFIYQSIAAVAITTVLVKIAASLHQDARPFVRDGVHPYFGHSTDNGFPSDHTTYSALLAFLVLHYSRKLGIGLALVSLCIGSARVIAGVHHGQDIVAGLLIGAIGAVCGVYLVKLVGQFSKKQPTEGK
jgi:undecaprenyl-diphosphatase